MAYDCDSGDYYAVTTLNSEKLAALAKDLTKDYPRSPRELLAGYIIGMRTLDKCRASLNNSLGEYHFDCPVDNMFLDSLALRRTNSKISSPPGPATRKLRRGFSSTLNQENESKSLSGIMISDTNVCPKWMMTSRNTWKITFRNLYPSTFSTTSTTSSISMMPKKKGWRRKN